MRTRDSDDFAKSLRIVTAPGMIRPVSTISISQREAAVVAAYRMLTRFKFPWSGFSAGTYKRVPYTMSTARLRMNQRIGLPWDTPRYQMEHEAVRDWEAKWNLTFVPGTGMAAPDDPRAFIVTNRWLPVR